jgi:hypothetical protein
VPEWLLQAIFAKVGDLRAKAGGPLLLSRRR